MPFHTPSSGHRPTEHRFAPFRKKDKVVAFTGVIFVLIGLAITGYIATQAYEREKTVFVFLLLFIGLFAGLLATGIFSALAELFYLIFKYPKDWNSLVSAKEETQEDNLPKNV